MLSRKAATTGAAPAKHGAGTTVEAAPFRDVLGESSCINTILPDRSAPPRPTRVSVGRGARSGVVKHASQKIDAQTPRPGQTKQSS